MTEVWFGQDVVRSHHAFLALVREEKHKDPVIEEEVHFKDEGFLKLKVHQYPNVEFGNGDHFDELKTYGHISGHENHMRSLWQEVIKTAQLIGNGKLPFKTQRMKYSFNCRSATIALLNTIGLTYYSPEDVETDVGIEANILAKLGLKPSQYIIQDNQVILKVS